MEDLQFEQNLKLILLFIHGIRTSAYLNGNGDVVSVVDQIVPKLKQAESTNGILAFLKGFVFACDKNGNYIASVLEYVEKDILGKMSEPQQTQPKQSFPDLEDLLEKTRKRNIDPWRSPPYIPPSPTNPWPIYPTYPYVGDPLPGLAPIITCNNTTNYSNVDNAVDCIFTLNEVTFDNLNKKENDNE